LTVDEEGEVQDLPGVDHEASEVPSNVHLKAEYLMAGVMEAAPLNSEDDAVDGRQRDLVVHASVPSLRNPIVDTTTRKRTVGDNSVSEASHLGNGAERRDKDREW
jgi:hypothetical protein